MVGLLVLAGGGPEADSGESSRIQRGYGHYFDLCLVNSNLERTFRELQAAMEKLRTEPQWVPVSGCVLSLFTWTPLSGS